MKSIIYKHIRDSRTIWYFGIILGLCFSICSCKKYLDAKPDQTITTPSTIADLQGILNNYDFINGNYPSASEVSSDDFYLTTAAWQGMIEPQRDYYTWQKYSNGVGDYLAPYQAIEYANVVLDALPNISDGDQQSKNTVKGNALFIRGSYHFALSQLFAKVYDKNSAKTDLGIALRLTSDIQVKPVRSTLADTYNSILSDLQNSIQYLPSVPNLKYEASKAAAYGMLARVYLSMSDYKNAGLNADSALNLYSKLIDYNTINSDAVIPFVQFNNEVIYDSRSNAPQALDQSIAKVDTTLFANYSDNDLRKSLFFTSNPDGSVAFKGNYTGQRYDYLFTGIATDELYLIQAETAVRGGNSIEALRALNTLLVTRWKQGTYVPYVTTDQQQLLTLILQERRKQLLFRTLRWTDLRRLNLQPDFAKKLLRNLNGTLYSLDPGNLRYVFEIDETAIRLSGLVQNP